ncbi:MAG: hypothetical protein GY869_10160 [Planctomycetes bacterium]|nr:hypothetical protein [Planctomycetota bacterium]
MRQIVPIIICLFSTILFTSFSLGQQTTLSVNQDIPVSDPNDDPNLIIAEIEAFMQPLPDESKPSPLLQSDKLWQNRYHPQVTPRTFALLSYPYYRGGREYVLSELPALDSQQQLLDLPESAAADPNDNNMTKTLLDLALLNELRLSLERCCDLVSRWRMINESPYTTLEIVYSVELTKTGTGIYQNEPQLAINVKRTIGQIGRRNRQFDLISRLVYQSLLTGNIDKALLSRMDKQITELETLITHLTEQNDAISVQLGIGKVNRESAFTINPEPISFSVRKCP